MKATAFLISLILWLGALPTHAQDRDDLSSWSLAELCENKDKRKYAGAVFAEIERREIFDAFEVGLIREGRIDIGMSEAALHCAHGLPRRTEVLDGETWLVYFVRRYDLQWRRLLRMESSMVAEIREGTTPSAALPYDTFSGRNIDTDGTLSDGCESAECAGLTTR